MSDQQLVPGSGLRSWPARVRSGAREARSGLGSGGTGVRRRRLFQGALVLETMAVCYYY